MTTATQGNDIQFTPRTVAIVVVPILCGLAASLAVGACCWFEFSTENGGGNSLAASVSIWVPPTSGLDALHGYRLAPFCGAVGSLDIRSAVLADISEPIRGIAPPTEGRARFCHFASLARFGSLCLRHDNLQSDWLCSGPGVGHEPTLGLTHTTMQFPCKGV